MKALRAGGAEGEMKVRRAGFAFSQRTPARLLVCLAYLRGESPSRSDGFAIRKSLLPPIHLLCWNVWAMSASFVPFGALAAK